MSDNTGRFGPKSVISCKNADRDKTEMNVVVIDDDAMRNYVMLSQVILRVLHIGFNEDETEGEA